MDLLTVLRWIALLLLLLLVGTSVRLLGEVLLAGRKPPQRSDAVIILGAAVWQGSAPSPVFRRRIAAGAALYQSHFAPWIVTTGGLGRNPPEEGIVARDVLVREHHIPSERILVEQTSHTTMENLSNAMPMLRARHVRRVLLVSDGYHLARAERLARSLGLEPQGIAADRRVGWRLLQTPQALFREAYLLLFFT